MKRNTKHAVTLNDEQRLFVLKEGDGYSCHGYDVVRKLSETLAQELEQPAPTETGTLNAYYYYSHLLRLGRQKHETTDWRSKADLTPQLIGLEGKTVEATAYGDTYRFRVGKSTGWMPCHLEIPVGSKERFHGSAAKVYDAIQVIS